MKFEVIKERLEGLLFMTPDEGKKVYDFIINNELTECLELGFAYGVSSCYVAAALDEMGKGHLTSVDMEKAKSWQKPSIEETTARVGLDAYVTPVREKTSYTWFLKQEIERNTVNGVCVPKYDFCYIDGCKNWTVDGLAFFCVDKLLKPGGWILFDDYKWTYGATGREQTDGIIHAQLSDEERDNPHVEAIFRLLVQQHPDYADFKVEGNWAWAHKSPKATK
ncbi:class I SAM-dependent methyltransferase [Geomonas anaerohicana]|uniref:Class I SAM-dependent methyltransferase n=1 Tax=Geomonas anaerohicana TaxID=2798583 RepID=A0ABS0YI11_9BACT|nr:class I SAM-dependent methyltransferase [Geomonas anaerohicana]MBJ6751549.1 class I SAM-dependent methyltransferase [Geomonas anaerohicana]